VIGELEQEGSRVQRFKGSKVESIWLKEAFKLSPSMKARWTTRQVRLEGWKVGREVKKWKGEKVKQRISQESFSS